MYKNRKLFVSTQREMEGVDGDSATESATSSPSCEQKYGDLDKCFQEPLPNPGPILPKLSEFVLKEEEPSVEKDICREKRPSAFESNWGKTNPRSSKRKARAYNFATVYQAAQTLVDIKNSKSNLSSSPKFLKEPNMGQPRFLFQKKLTCSDIRQKSLVLPKEEAEIHLARVCPQEGTTASIVMKDFDTGQSWKFGYRLWICQNKIMHILKQTGEFTKAHELQEGHLVCFYKIPQGDYVIQGIRMCLGENVYVP